MQKIFFFSIAASLLLFIVATNFFKRKNKFTAQEKNTITITGNTKNINGHAAVVGDSAGIYYVDGMDKWDNDWLDKTVKVTGDLSGGKSEPSVIRAAAILLQQDGYWVSDKTSTHDKN